LPARIIQNLMRDAVARYVKAFGGAEELGRAIKTQGLSAQDLPPVLANCLEERGIRLKPSK
jgi:hypothetical protein